VCIDGAPAVTGRIKGFISRLKQDFPNIGSTHCFLHREALVAKAIPAALRSVMDSVFAMVNYIKTRADKTRLHKVMCKEAGARHEALVLHTNISCLPKGKVLSRFYELRNELLEILLKIDPFLIQQYIAIYLCRHIYIYIYTHTHTPDDGQPRSKHVLLNIIN
jgi:hypothetical protein